MYKDNSLLPREAVRLAALGILAGGPLSYAALASEVRQFTGRIAGPSPELMGTSIELLRYEGLVRTLDGKAADRDRDAPLTLTEDGKRELFDLLSAPVRPPSNDVARLILALKFRFLHLMETGPARDQIAMMIEASEGEHARLLDLRARSAEDPGHLVAWLDFEIGQIEARLDWLRAFSADL